MRNAVKVLSMSGVLLLAPALANGNIGTGPCSMAWMVPNLISGDPWHSFGDVPYNHSSTPEVVRDKSHFAAKYGWITSGQHPVCEAGCDPDGEEPCECEELEGGCGDPHET